MRSKFTADGSSIYYYEVGLITGTHVSPSWRAPCFVFSYVLYPFANFLSKSQYPGCLENEHNIENSVQWPNSKLEVAILESVTYNEQIEFDSNPVVLLFFRFVWKVGSCSLAGHAVD